MSPRQWLAIIAIASIIALGCALCGPQACEAMP